MLLSTSPWIGHNAWMYASSARVKAGLCGVEAGWETAGIGPRTVVVASRVTANAIIPSRARTVTASTLPLTLNGHRAWETILPARLSPVARNPSGEAAPLRPICFLACRAEGRGFHGHRQLFC